MTTPKPLKASCSHCSKPAKVSEETGLVKSHTRNGVKCPGSGQPPMPKRNGGWVR